MRYIQEEAKRRSKKNEEKSFVLAINCEKKDMVIIGRIKKKIIKENSIYKLIWGIFKINGNFWRHYFRILIFATNHDLIVL